jgi:hypothetical protein
MDKGYDNGRMLPAMLAGNPPEGGKGWGFSFCLANRRFSPHFPFPSCVLGLERNQERRPAR